MEKHKENSEKEEQERRQRELIESAQKRHKAEHVARWPQLSVEQLREARLLYLKNQAAKISG
jgi:hypothetical protein